MSHTSPPNQPDAKLAYAIGFENAVEQKEAIALKVHGHIPGWLTGSLYRTGPGTFRVPSKANPSVTTDIAHWFDGLGMNHCFKIRADGSVMYQNHSSAEGLYDRIADTETVPNITFGNQDPCKTIFRKFFTMFKPSASSSNPDDINVSVTLTPDMPGIDTPNSNTTNSPHYLVAKTDAATLQVVDANTLEPLQAIDYSSLDSRIDGPLSAAHSCSDSVTGDFYNYNLKLGKNPSYRIFRLRPGDKSESRISASGCSVDILAEIQDVPAAYLHSFAMTQKYIVLCVWQADYSLKGASILFNRNIMSSIKEWTPNRESLFYVINRHEGGLVAKYKTRPFFAFHLINAHDTEDGDVVIDISIYDDHAVLNAFYLEKLRNLDKNNLPMGYAARFVLENVSHNQERNKSREAKIARTFPVNSNIELPTVHPALYHRSYRFAYGINKDHSIPHTFASRIIKLDMSNPNADPKFWGAPNYTPGEPIFVPRPGTNAIENPESEDDGVLLTVVLNNDTQKSMLVVLDAKEMKEEGRAEMDSHFPFGFHGAWVS